VVGIYSFASMIAEGFNQLPFVLRTAINPVITTAYLKKSPSLLQRIITRSVRKYYRYFMLLGVAVLIGYPIALYIFGINDKLQGSWTVLAILISGICLSSGYLPFQLIFNQLGFPALQTLFLFMYFLTNLVLNFILVPFIGMYGAAIATAIAYIFQIFYMKYLVKRKISINI
jgi:O-antigen/teichoic acid export membrane protein